jgi:hypothetical protein
MFDLRKIKNGFGVSVSTRITDVSGVLQVHRARVQQRDRGREVAGGTPDAGRFRNDGGVTRFLLDPRPPGEDPLHRGAAEG